MFPHYDEDAIPVENVIMRADVEEAAVLVHVANEGAVHIHAQDSMVWIAASRKA